MKSLLTLLTLFAFTSPSFASEDAATAESIFNSIRSQITLGSVTRADLDKTGIYAGRCVYKLTIGSVFSSASAIQLNAPSDGSSLGPMESRLGITVRIATDHTGERNLNAYDNLQMAAWALNEDGEFETNRLSLNGSVLMTRLDEYGNGQRVVRNRKMKFAPGRIYTLTEIHVQGQGINDTAYEACYYYKKLN